MNAIPLLRTVVLWAPDATMEAEKREVFYRRLHFGAAPLISCEVGTGVGSRLVGAAHVFAVE